MIEELKNLYRNIKETIKLRIELRKYKNSIRNYKRVVELIRIAESNLDKETKQKLKTTNGV